MATVTEIRRAKGQCEPTVFWVRKDGDIMLAPHTDMTPFPGYERVECTTPSSIERMSRKMAAQEEGKLRKLKIEELVRAKPKMDQIISNCKLRLAAGCISKADEALTRNTLASMERKLNTLVKLMVGSLQLTEGALMIERKATPTGAAFYNQKKATL